MSARVSQSLVLWRFGLLIARVCFAKLRYFEGIANACSDANLFKNAFIEAQQQTEALFSEEAAASEPKEEAEPKEEKKEE